MTSEAGLAHAFRHAIHMLQDLLPLDGDAETATLLAAHSKTLVRDLTPALSRRLELVPGAGAATSWRASVPQLRLQFFSIHEAVQSWTPATTSTALHAFAELVHHSQRLNAFPTLKTQFWLDVLQSDIARVHPPGSTLWPSSSSPVPPGALDRAVEDALVAFLTTPRRPLLQASTSIPRASIGVAFGSCRQHGASLEVLECVLERAFASATRPFELRLLDVSDESLVPHDLAVLARIVHKCVHEYGVEELRLDQIHPTQRAASAHTEGVQATDATPAAMLDIARIVYGMDALLALASRQSSTPPLATARSRSCRLRTLSMSKNFLCAELFAMRFSALRYGGSLDADVTMFLAAYNTGDKRHADCWRWLAFGLFYPRPKRFADRFRLRTIGHIDHCPLVAETIARTLHNPAAELIFHGENECGGSEVAPTTELLVAIVAAGASVDVFQTGNRATPTWTDTLPAACELEVLYERADGSVCVVLPGVGLGWVAAAAVERIEREPLSSARSEQDGRFAGGDTRWSADLSGTWDPKSPRASMQSIVETVGRQFGSLNFGHSRFAPRVLPIVLEHCTNLTQLALGKQSVPAQEGDALLDALGGVLGQRLEVLNLSFFGETTPAFYAQLFSMLRDTDHFPALCELRLAGHFLDASQLEALTVVLQLRPKLALVELHTAQHQGMFGSHELRETDQAKRRMDAVFHGQLLRAALPIKSKLAFLSVVERSRESESVAQALDTLALSTIFAFAVDRQVRRILIWNDEIETSRRW